MPTTMDRSVEQVGVALTEVLCTVEAELLRCCPPAGNSGVSCTI